MLSVARSRGMAARAPPPACGPKPFGRRKPESLGPPGGQPSCGCGSPMTRLRNMIFSHPPGEKLMIPIRSREISK
jgi:hypothetical protein